MNPKPEKPYEPLNILRGMQDDINTIIDLQNELKHDISLLKMKETEVGIKIRKFKEKWNDAVRDPEIWFTQTDEKKEG